MLQGRINDAVLSFVVNNNDWLSDDHTSSYLLAVPGDDLARRRIRLLSSLATPENESFTAGLVHASEMRQRRTLQKLQRVSISCTFQLRERRIAYIVRSRMQEKKMNHLPFTQLPCGAFSRQNLS